MQLPGSIAAIATYNGGQAVGPYSRSLAIAPEKQPAQPTAPGIHQVRTARLIGFLPTMHKPRRASSKYWLAQLDRLAERNGTRVLAPINDLASIADKTLAGHPYARAAEDVLRAIRN